MKLVFFLPFVLFTIFVQWVQAQEFEPKKVDFQLSIKSGSQYHTIVGAKELQPVGYMKVINENTNEIVFNDRVDTPQLTVEGTAYITGGIDDSEISSSLFPSIGNNPRFIGEANQVNVYSITGQHHKVFTPTTTRGNYSQFDLSGLTNGVYIMQYTDKKGKAFSKKFIQKHDANAPVKTIDDMISVTDSPKNEVANALTNGRSARTAEEEIPYRFVLIAADSKHFYPVDTVINITKDNYQNIELTIIRKHWTRAGIQVFADNGATRAVGVPVKIERFNEPTSPENIISATTGLGQDREVFPETNIINPDGSFFGTFTEDNAYLGSFKVSIDTTVFYEHPEKVPVGFKPPSGSLIVTLDAKKDNIDNQDIFSLAKFLFGGTFRDENYMSLNIKGQTEDGRYVRGPEVWANNKYAPVTSESNFTASQHRFYFPYDSVHHWLPASEASIPYTMDLVNGTRALNTDGTTESYNIQPGQSERVSEGTIIVPWSPTGVRDEHNRVLGEYTYTITGIRNP